MKFFGVVNPRITTREAIKIMTEAKSGATWWKICREWLKVAAIWIGLYFASAGYFLPFIKIIQQISKSSSRPQLAGFPFEILVVSLIFAALAAISFAISPLDISGNNAL